MASPALRPGNASAADTGGSVGQPDIKTDLEIVNKIGYTIKVHGEVSEWSMVPDSKSGVRQRT